MIYVVYASQSKMVKDGINKILDKEVPERDPMNSVYLDMGNRKLVELYDEASYLPLGYEKKAVVAENFYYLEKSKSKPKLMKDDEIEGLLSYFRNPMEEVIVLLLVYSDTLDEKGEIYKALADGNAKFIPVLPFTDDKWDAYIPRYFENRGTHIEDSAAKLLKERINGDYSTFVNEADKLITYVDGEIVTYDIVEKLVSRPLEDDVFVLSNALCHKDIGLAIAIYKDLKVKSAESVSLIRLLSREFRFLNQVAFLRDRGYSIDQMMSELNQKYGRIKAGLNSLRYIETEDIGKMLEDLYQAELNIFTGKVDQDIAFQLLLANFAS
ncbi:MAG: DNA polymerase III subunit delta [Bacilli bacterium]|nr:DNA polymerase III subunit delta [Bacilli bacterium]